MNRYVKILLGVVGAVVVGAIGSGLWEVVFSPLFKYFGSLFVYVFSTLNVSYENSLYSRIPYRVTYGDLLGAPLGDTLFIGFLIFLFMDKEVLDVERRAGSIFRLLKKASEDSKAENFDEYGSDGCLHARAKRLKFRIKMIRFALISLFSFGLFMISLVSARYEFISGIENKAEISLAIVRSALDDASYNRLYAEYMSIHKKADYIKFKNDINALALKQGLSIPMQKGT
ncbi:hypothetical protein [Asticcacaulis solisilvae]|uniref:hypothetical protein n=1 Tax=Asticcacaulis solisilvae TaxID=1217274 RepID=UPI003FD7E0C8